MKGFLQTISILLLIGVLAIGCLIFGNPVSYALAWGTAYKYIQDNHADTDYEIKKIDYIFIGGVYRVEVYSPTKQDERFHLGMNGLGAIENNNYSLWVENRYTVKWRLIDEYNEQGDKVFASENISEGERLDFSLNFLEHGKPFIRDGYYKAHPNATDLKDLPLNTAECTKEIAAANGVIDYRRTVNGLPTYEEVAQDLLRIKSTADENDFAFHAINYGLAYTLDNGYNTGAIHIGYIYYEDIYEEGLVERIKQREAEYKAYLEEEFS